MSNKILEVVVFKLAEGVTDELFLESAQGIEGWLETKPGFLNRRLSKDENGMWLDLIEWESMDEAQSAAAEIMSQPAGQAFSANIDGPSVQMYHMQTIHTFN